MLTTLLAFSGSVKDLENSKEKLEKEVDDLKAKMKNKDATHQSLLDEHQALLTVSESSESKVSSLEKENDQLVSAREVTVILQSLIKP